MDSSGDPHGELVRLRYQSQVHCFTGRALGFSNWRGVNFFSTYFYVIFELIEDLDIPKQFQVSRFLTKLENLPTTLLASVQNSLSETLSSALCLIVFIYRPIKMS